MPTSFKTVLALIKNKRGYDVSLENDKDFKSLHTLIDKMYQYRETRTGFSVTCTAYKTTYKTALANLPNYSYNRMTDIITSDLPSCSCNSFKTDCACNVRDACSYVSTSCVCNGNCSAVSSNCDCNNVCSAVTSDCNCNTVAYGGNCVCANACRCNHYGKGACPDRCGCEDRCDCNIRCDCDSRTSGCTDRCLCDVRTTDCSSRCACNGRTSDTCVSRCACNARTPTYCDTVLNCTCNEVTPSCSCNSRNFTGTCTCDVKQTYCEGVSICTCNTVEPTCSSNVI